MLHGHVIGGVNNGRTDTHSLELDCSHISIRCRIECRGFYHISLGLFSREREHMRELLESEPILPPFPCSLESSALIYDLERPHLFWKLFLTFQPSSVMSLGAWLLLFFSLASFVHFYLWLPEDFELLAILQWLPKRLDKMKIIKTIKSSSFLARWRRQNLLRWRGWVALIGILLSIFVGIYTGVLLGALVGQAFLEQPYSPLALSSLGHEDR